MAGADAFTATGPADHDSGVPFAAFSSKATGMVYGANVQGDRAGLYAECVRAETGRDSDVEGVGAVGVGDNFGVVGRTFPSPDRPGIAGVYAQHNRNGVGVIGVTMRGGVGLVGKSVENLGNPLQTFAPPAQSPAPAPQLPPVTSAADGSGTGVLGASGSGDGVVGASGSGSGVHGTSGSGAGVRGESDGDAVVGISSGGRGGRFESGTSEDGSAVGQVGLVPRPMAVPEFRVVTPTVFDGTVLTSLPRSGRGGDLLATRGDDGTCTLWFCTRDSDDVTAATWGQVLLGHPSVDSPPEFVDWTEATATGATGTLHGQPVTLTGPLGTGSNLDQTFTAFTSSAFTPPVPQTDCVEIAAGPGHTFTLTFAEPVQDPVMLLHSFGSVLTFEAGTVVTAVSGDSGFTASGNIASGQTPPDVDGTLRLRGVFSSITFTAVVNLPDQTIPDGIYLQIGAVRP